MSAVALVAFGADGSCVRRWQVAGHTYNPDEGEVVGLAAMGGPDRALQVRGGDGASGLREGCYMAEIMVLEGEGGIFMVISSGLTWRQA